MGQVLHSRATTTEAVRRSIQHSQASIRTLANQYGINAKTVAKLYLFVAVDRTSKFALAELHKGATRPIAADFLRHLIAAVPHKIHTIWTDNGIQFADRKKDRYAFKVMYEFICQQWHKHPERFIHAPSHHTSGLYS